MFNSFKNILIGTLSILLGFQPALLAASQPTGATLKAWIEFSEFGKSPVTLREFYNRNFGYLPVSVRNQLEPIVNEYPNAIMPKFDVSKVKGPNGQDLYQFQAVQNGKSVSMTVLGGNENFLEINGKKIAQADMQDVPAYFGKVGLDQKVINENFNKRTPSSQLLTANQVTRLNTTQKKVYFKQLRDLLQSMEQVQNAGLGVKHKTSMNDSFEKWNVILQMLNPEAQADDSGAACIAGGWPATVAFNNKRIDPVSKAGQPGLSCASDGNGGVPSNMQSPKCGKQQILCNPAVYGDGGTCADISQTMTASCNSSVNGNDIPDLSKNKKQLNDLREAADAQAKDLSAKCQSATFTANGLQADQKATCDEFQKRLEIIESWHCDKPAFANSANGKRLCADPGYVNPPDQVCREPQQSIIGPHYAGTDSATTYAVKDPPPTTVIQGPPSSGGSPGADSGTCVKSGGGSAGGPPGPGNTSSAGSPPDSRIYCDHLPDWMSLTQSTCEHGDVKDNVGNADGKNGSCVPRDGVAPKSLYVCTCDDGARFVGKMKCSAVAKSDDDGKGSRDHDKKEKDKKSGPNWLLLFGLALGGLLLFHFYLSKSAAQQSFQNVNPPLALPPIAPPTPPPTPRPDPTTGVH